MKIFNIITFLVLSVIALHGQDEVRLVTDFNPGSENGFTDEAEIIGTVANSILIADKGNFISSDGTAEGTQVIGELGNDGRVLHSRAELNGKLYFILDNDDNDYSLIEFDPESSSMNTLITGYDFLSNLLSYNEKLYLSIDGDDNLENGFYSIDVETATLEEIFKVGTWGGIRDAMVHNGLIYTIQWSADKDGTYLSSSDGTPGNVDEYYYFHNGSEVSQSATINMTSAADLFYFWYSNEEEDYVMFVSDGTSSGTQELKTDFDRISFFDFDANRAIGTIGNKIFFRATEEGDFSDHLWMSDGTVAGTQRIELDTDLAVVPRFFTNFNSRLYFYGAHTKGSFSDQYGVIITDGTVTGTEVAFDFSNHPDKVNRHGWHVVSHMDRLFFEVSSDMFGNELYSSDGTEDGTTNISDIAPGAASGFTYNYYSAGANLFFFGSTDELGVELYVYDPGPSSTYKLISEELLVSPNPAFTYLTLPIELSDSDEVIVSNVTGRSFGITKDNNKQIDISGLAQGTYILSIRKDNKVYKSKFIKLSQEK